MIMVSMDCSHSLLSKYIEIMPHPLATNCRVNYKSDTHNHALLPVAATQPLQWKTKNPLPIYGRVECTTNMGECLIPSYTQNHALLVLFMASLAIGVKIVVGRGGKTLIHLDSRVRGIH